MSLSICRCTGYTNIVKAVRAAQDEMRPAEAAPVEKADVPQTSVAPDDVPTAPAQMLEQSET